MNEAFSFDRLFYYLISKEDFHYVLYTNRLENVLGEIIYLDFSIIKRC